MAMVVELKQNTEFLKKAVSFCKDALEEEDLAAFVGVLFRKDGSYRTMSSRNVSHHEMIGILTDAIHDACEDVIV